jgi:hypothetical protein
MSKYAQVASITRMKTTASDTWTGSGKVTFFLSTRASYSRSRTSLNMKKKTSIEKNSINLMSIRTSSDKGSKRILKTITRQFTSRRPSSEQTQCACERTLSMWIQSETSEIEGMSSNG